jgi:hypothetical protein
MTSGSFATNPDLSFIHIDGMPTLNLHNRDQREKRISLLFRTNTTKSAEQIRGKSRCSAGGRAAKRAGGGQDPLSLLLDAVYRNIR